MMSRPSRRNRTARVARATLATIPLLLSGCIATSTSTDTLATARWEMCFTQNESGFIAHEPVDLHTVWDAVDDKQSLDDGGIRVHYAPPFEPAARKCFTFFKAARAICADDLGIEWNPFEICLVPVWRPLNSASWSHTGDVRTYPLIVRCGDSQGDALFDDNSKALPAIIHKAVESSLVWPHDASRPSIKFDEAPGLLPQRNPAKSRCTRWFREGLATYAGLRAADGAPDGPLSFKTVRCDVFDLHAVRSKLFLWSNHRAAEDLADSRYSAATALFVWLSEQYGDDFVKRIMTRLNERQTWDGVELQQLLEQEMEIDSLPDYCDALELPWLGISVGELQPPAASRLGLQQRDGLAITWPRVQSMMMSLGNQLLHGSVIGYRDDNRIALCTYKASPGPLPLMTNVLTSVHGRPTPFVADFNRIVLSLPIGGETDATFIKADGQKETLRLPVLPLGPNDVRPERGRG